MFSPRYSLMEDSERKKCLAEWDAQADKFWFRFKRSRSWWPEHYAQCALETCDMCSKPMKGKQRRQTMFGYDRSTVRKEGYPPLVYVCLGCWNKAEALNRRIEKSNEIRTAIRKVQQEISNVRKGKSHRNDRPASPVSG